MERRTESLLPEVLKKSLVANLLQDSMKQSGKQLQTDSVFNLSHCIFSPLKRV